MKIKNIKTAALILMILLTITAAIFHLTARDTVPAGCLRIVFNGTKTEVELSSLDLQHIQGAVVNGKGEERTIEAQGIAVSELIALAGTERYSAITVTADDEYHAELTAEDVAVSENAYFILQDDGGVQLIVFHDTNSKRNVTNVIQVEVS